MKSAMTAILVNEQSFRKYFDLIKLLRLFFKKLYLFQEIVKALSVKHNIHGSLQVIPSRLEQIMQFSTPENPNWLRAF